MFIQFKLEDHPNWPRIACSECIRMIEEIDRFKTRILTSHKILYAALYRTMFSSRTSLRRKCRLCLKDDYSGMIESLFRNEQGLQFTYARTIIDLMNIVVSILIT